MERLRSIARLWNWLPAFRVIAETEHLPTASRQLHVSPSALSRTLKLLEDEVGRPLFRRAGKRLELNREGELLLSASRNAMRLVHGGLLAVRDEARAGPVALSCQGLMADAYLPGVLVRLVRAHPGLEPQVGDVPTDRICAALLQGQLDVAFLSTPLAHARLTTILLGEASNGLYCGEGHPLFGREAVSLDEVRGHPFVAPPADSSGVTFEGWPPYVPRTVRARVSRMQAGVGVCATGELLAVIPDVVARRHPRPLHRLPLDLIPAAPLLAVTRPAIGGDGLAEIIVAAMRAEIAAAPG